MEREREKRGWGVRKAPRERIGWMWVGSKRERGSESGRENRGVGGA